MPAVLLLTWNALVTAESERETVYRRQGEAVSSPPDWAEGKTRVSSRNETDHIYRGLCVLQTKNSVKGYATRAVPDEFSSLLSKDPPTLPEELTRRLFKIRIYLLLAAHPQDPYTRD